MHRVVLDTNVIVSAALTSTGNPAKLIELVSDGEIVLYYSKEMLEEYEDVFSREKLGFSLEAQRAAISMITEKGILVTPVKSDTPFSDMDDLIFFDTAKAADAYLITGNTKHYPTEAFIKTPAQFLGLINFQV